MGDEKRQKPPQGAVNWEAEVKPRGPGARADLPIATLQPESPMFSETLMEEICERSNLRAALPRVRANQGSPGIDNMTVDKLPGFLQAPWPALKEQLRTGRYHPKPVKRVEIPKPGSQEKRQLGIPCVVDRFIQQAVLPGLQRRWDATFSEHSYGFRPGRSAQQAGAKAQADLPQGYAYVVAIDLERFFDRVCYDRLRSKL